MNIGFDFDDVIVGTHSLKSQVAYSLYGVAIPLDCFRREFVVGKGLLTSEQYTMVGREVFSGKYPMEPVPGALDTISLLMGEGHSVRIVTNRSLEWKTLKPAQDWRAECGLDIPITGVVYGTSKAEACAGLDLFVDDDSIKLHQLVGVVPHLLFFCWPHNVHEIPPKNSVNVCSWTDIYNYIKGA